MLPTYSSIPDPSSITCVSFRFPSISSGLPPSEARTLFLRRRARDRCAGNPASILHDLRRNNRIVTRRRAEKFLLLYLVLIERRAAAFQPI